MSRLLLVRHGDTASNSRERYWGHSDVKLSRAGLGQAEKLRDRLTSEKINVIYASDLERSWLTAQIIAQKHQLDINICPELREFNFGVVEGLTFDEISRLHPELAEFWASQNPKLKFPGGESLGDLRRRVNRFRQRLEKHTPEETVLIVAHAGALRILLCQLLGIGQHHWRQLRLNLASLSIVEIYPERTVLGLLNDVSHLDSELQ
ncbi:MAG: histidine phosphatase family protein [Dehalococcoidia bacterium]|nr:MAG: histidine phosphatase family protein [Dehalococcoidia bacterium]